MLYCLENILQGDHNCKVAVLMGWPTTRFNCTSEMFRETSNTI